MRSAGRKRPTAGYSSDGRDTGYSLLPYASTYEERRQDGDAGHSKWLLGEVNHESCAMRAKPPVAKKKTRLGRALLLLREQQAVQWFLRRLQLIPKDAYAPLAVVFVVAVIVIVGMISSSTSGSRNRSTPPVVVAPPPDEESERTEKNKRYEELLSRNDTYSVRCSTVHKVYNVRIGTTIRLQGVYNVLEKTLYEYTAAETDEFEVDVLLPDGNTKTIASSDMVVIKVIAASESALRVEMSPKRETRSDLQIRLHIVADHRVIRKWIGIKGSGTITRIGLMRMALPEATARGSSGIGEALPHSGPTGVGQPVYWNGFFTGIEHPLAQNFAYEDVIQLEYHEVIKLTPKMSKYSPKVVLGCTTNGKERFAFWKYIYSIRPQEPRVHIVVDNHFQFAHNYLNNNGPQMTDELLFTDMAALKDVQRRLKLPIWSYIVSDGWDGQWVPKTGIWGRFAPQRFPGGFEAVQTELGDHASGVGLWLSPSGGTGLPRERRLHFGRTLYEHRHGQFDILGAVYGTHVDTAVVNWLHRGVNFFKLDGVDFTSSDEELGAAAPILADLEDDEHRVHYYDASRVNRFIVTLQHLRKIQKGVDISFMSDSFPSPWWMMYIDYVWRGGELAPTTQQLQQFAGRQTDTLHLHDRYTTYIDVQLAFQTSRSELPAAVFSSAAVVATSVVNLAATEKVALDVFERNVWFVVSRGSLLKDLYIEADLLGTDQWSLLQSALLFAVRHSSVLMYQRMVLGNPENEVYGYATMELVDGVAFVSLRNPTASTAEVSFILPDIVALPSDVSTTTTYRVEVEYNGHQVLVPSRVTGTTNWKLTMPSAAVVFVRIIRQ